MKTTNSARRLLAGLTLVWLTSDSWRCLAQVDTPGGDNSSAPASQVQSETKALSAQRATHQTDLFTGSFGYSIPIEGAPARNGTQPPLALVYSSRGENGWCGVGWSLEIGYIERNTKDGFPMKYDTATPQAPLNQYDDAKGFMLNLFGKSAKLLQHSGPEYRAEVETDFLRCFFDQTYNRWEVYDKSGNVYRFGFRAGSGANSVLLHPSWTGTHTRTFRWALDEIITATGDRTIIAYQTIPTSNPGSARVLYPDKISYNGHTSRNGYAASHAETHTIEFHFAARTDARLSYRSGFRAVQDQRLTNIICRVNGQQVRRYSFGYGAYSPATKRSLLRSVTFYGHDNTPFPAVQTFDYQGNSTPVSFQNKIEWDQLYYTSSGHLSDRCLIGRNSSGATLMDIVDMDGDGLPDRVRWNERTTAIADSYLVQRNLGRLPDGTQGRFETGPGGSGYDFGPTSSATLDQSQQIVPKSFAWSALNAGNLSLLDINGDGRPDRVANDSTFNRSYGANYAYNHFEIQLNLGNRFSSPSTSAAWPVDTQGGGYPFWDIAFVERASANALWMALFDINGDSLPDRVMATRAAPRNKYLVGLNTGTGFQMNGSTTVTKAFSFLSQGVTDQLNWNGVGSDYVHLADINGDGLVDRIMLPRRTNNVACPTCPLQDATLTKFLVEFNNGYSFEQADWPGVNPQGPNYNYYAYVQKYPRLGLFDINGDGLPDRVMTKESVVNKSIWLVQLNNGLGFDAAIEVAIDNQGKTTAELAEWFGIQGVGDATDPYSGQTVTAMLDMNGDGLLDRVMSDYAAVTGATAKDYFWVQLNAGPLPDLMKTVNNGIGGVTTITYKPSTAWDNRENPADVNSGKLLPFPVQTVTTVAENDGVNALRTTTYAYEGGFYDGSRREFAGFAKVTTTDASLRKKVHFFHQGGGQNRASIGEYLDLVSGVGAFAKKGMAYRIETYGNDSPAPLLYNVVVHQVNQVSQGNGRWFPFVHQTFNYDYPNPGGGTPKVTATRFAYNTANGNLTNKTLYGQVPATVDITNLNPPADSVAADTQHHHISYATIQNNGFILDHPEIVKLTSDDAGATVLQETKYTYNANSGTLATKHRRICPGQYAVVTHGDYDAYGLPTLTTDAVGVQTKINAFDTTCHIYPSITRVRVAPPNDTPGDHITETTYDARSGSLLTSKGPMGIRVQNTYDAFFRLTETLKGTAPDAAPSLWVRRAGYTLGVISSGNAASYAHVKIQDGVDSANGVESRTYVDGFGRPIQTWTEAEAGNYRVVSTAYDERGQAFLATWPRFETGFTFIKPTVQPASWTGYDAAGRISQTRQRVEATFNGNGAFTGKTDSSGEVGTSPLAPRQWAYVHNGEPWWIVCTDEDGKLRRYQLDGFGRTNVIHEVDGANTYSTTLVHDRSGNLTEIVNSLTPTPDRIYFGYDDLGNLLAMADPHLGQWTYRRDRAGRLREQTDGKGQKVVLTYGATLSRLSTKQVYNAAQQLVSTATYTYDTGDADHTVYKGQLFQVTDGEGWEKHGYDTRGRLQKTTRHLNVNDRDYITTFAYNDADRITSTVYPNSGPTINYEYHTGGSLYRVSRPGPYYFYTAHAANFDEFGHVLQFTYGNARTTTRSYYPISKRLQSLSVPGVLSKSYRYSAADDVTFISGTGMPDTSIGYDNLHRISTYTGLGGSYAYDRVGNLTTSIEGGGSAYTYANPRRHAVRTAFNKTYLYDKCGNMIVRRGDTAGPQALDYDAENRLVRFSQAGSMVVEYGYAADGTRLWKRKNQDPNKLQVWIGNTYEEKEQDGTRKTLFHVFAGGQRICTFEPGSALAANGGGGYATHVGYYYQQDHLGSSSVLSDSAGQSREVNVWYPFGRTQTATPQAAFKVSNQFTGQVLDEETGLYYYGARYYDPELGRFIQADTIIPDLGNPQSYNRYSYTLNNPLKYVDPDGHLPLTAFASAGAQIGNWAVSIYNNAMATAGGLANPATRGQTLSDIAYGQAHGAFNWAVESAQAVNNMQPGAELVGYINNQALGAISGQGNEFIDGVGALTGADPNSPAAQTGDFGSRAALTGASLLVGGAKRQPPAAKGQPPAANETMSLLPARSPWPANRGFIKGTVERKFLMPGEVIDRYGFAGGRFVSPAGTSIEARALRPGTEKLPFHSYRVTKPIEVNSGGVQPWFGQPGLGTQHELPVSANTLVKRGFLEPVNP